MQAMSRWVGLVVLASIALPALAVDIDGRIDPDEWRGCSVARFGDQRQRRDADVLGTEGGDVITKRPGTIEDRGSLPLFEE